MNRCLDRIYGSEFSAQEIAAAVQDGRLLSMEIEFNQSCNFRCIYCYAADNPNRCNELSTEEFIDVISQAKELGARKIMILGGEPMLYPHLMEMIQFIRSLGMEDRTLHKRDEHHPAYGGGHCTKMLSESYLK